MKSGRVVRLVPVVLGLAILGTLLYNATMVDRVPPSYVIRVSSLSSDGKALTLTAINVVFSKDVQHDTAEKAFSIAPSVAGSFHWQGRTLIWTPSDKLPLSTTFRIHIAPGVRDADGNAQMGTGDLSFTTVGRPAVVAITPAVAAESVAVNTVIQVTFDRLMDTQKVVAGIKVQPAVTFKATWNAEVLTLAPDEPLAYATTYTITIGSPAVDSDGSTLSAFSTTFKTVGIGLHVRSMTPLPGVAGVSTRSRIAVVFDGPLDPTSAQGAITITPPVSGSTGVETLPDDRAPAIAAGASASPASSSAASSSAALTSNVLVFTPRGTLSPHTTYTVTTSTTVRRTDGEAATQQTWSFTTGEPPVNALNQITFLSSRSGVVNVWLMNPDGSNQREVTSELVPVSGFDVSGDGATIAYAAGGVVKKMAITGDGLQTLTSGGNFEYAPTFTPNGTGLVVGRRDSTGKDIGYWLVPMISGSDSKQLLTAGAPPLDSVDGAQSGLTGTSGEGAWWPRAAFSQDGSTLLLVRGADDVIEVVDMTGASATVMLDVQGNSRGTWVQSDGAFYVAGAPTGASTWGYWRVAKDGRANEVGWAVGDMDSSGTSLAYVAYSADGHNHLVTAGKAGAQPVQLTSDAQYSESGPSFSPDASQIVFARVGNLNPKISAGIWIVGPDGSSLTNLSVDGTCPRWLP